MLKFEPVSLGIKPLVDSYTFKYGEESCQHSFVLSWCLWDKYHDNFCEHQGFLYTLREKLCTDSVREYLFPHGPRDNRDALRQAIQNVIDDAHEHGAKAKFHTVTRSARDIIMALFPGRFASEYNRDLLEYIYTYDSLLTLSGPHLKNKRNIINGFFRRYNGRTVIEKISSREHLELIRELQRKWLAEKFSQEITPTLKTLLTNEHNGVQRALNDFFSVGLSGIVIFIDGVLEGYMYGYPLSPECFDAMSGKGFLDVPGISPVLKHEFVRLCCEGYKYVGFEEDMGVEGLRKMKTEYMPCRMTEKFSLTEI